MLARFCHFYPAYTAEAALHMPFRRFLALYRQISKLEAMFDLRALLVSVVGANPGEKGAAYLDYSHLLEKRAGIFVRPEANTDAIGLVNRGLAVSTTGSDLQDERARAAEAWQKMKAERGL